MIKNVVLVAIFAILAIFLISFVIVVLLAFFSVLIAKIVDWLGDLL